jgi:hypothetical protein
VVGKSWTRTSLRARRHRVLPNLDREWYHVMASSAPEARANIGCAVSITAAEQVVICAGGYIHAFKSDVWKLDLTDSSASWVTLPNMLATSEDPLVLASNGYIYAIAGYRNHGSMSNTVQVMDTSSSSPSWTYTLALPEVRRKTLGVASPGDSPNLYIFAGAGGDGNMVNKLLSAEVEDAGATGAISQWIDHGGLSGGLPLGQWAYPQLFYSDDTGVVFINPKDATSFELVSIWGATCDASSTITNGALNDCTSTLAHGATCTPTCDSGYTLSGIRSCSAGMLDDSAMCTMTSDSTSPAPEGPVHLGGGWTRVRHVPSGNTWHPATDHLAGTAVYGNSEDDSASWSVNFEDAVPGYNSFLFSTGDGVYWLAASKEAVVGEHYSNVYRSVISSSLTSAEHQVKWYNRAAFPEDPWVSLKDHYTAANEIFLYGAASFSASTHNKALLDHSGADVYIRISCTVTLPTNGGMGDCPSSLPSGSSCTPTCDSGYTLSGSRSCSAGILTDTAVCSGNSCDASGAIPNGDPGSACTSTLAHWSSCTPTCNTGYTLSGTRSCSAGILTDNTNCEPDPCTASLDNPNKNGDDGVYYCINDGTCYWHNGIVPLFRMQKRLRWSKL